ncbi:MAG TPA: polymer-forming cytoskeletal protein [Kofleriaceae bacterium]
MHARIVAPAVVVAPAPVYVEPAPPPPPEPAPVVVDEEAPELVDVSPGVQVIYDYDEPIFFSDGFYWHQDNGVWFSSRSYRGGWGRYDGVPMRFRGNFNVHAYAHYRPAGYVSHRGNGGRVEGRVEGRTEVHDNVHGEVHGEVHDNARVEGHGEVRDNAHVEGRTEVNGGAHVEGGAHVAPAAKPAPARATSKAPPPKKNTH